MTAALAEKPNSMKAAKSKAGFIFLGVYLAPTLAAFSFAFYIIAFHPVKSEFVGVYPVIMTLPWSILGLSLMGDSTMGDSTIVGIIILVAGSFVNSWIFYRIGVAAGKSTKGAERGESEK